MEQNIIYSYSLCVSLTLMLFFAFYFIFAPVPNKMTYANYLRSRRIIGVALLILVANYCVHFFAQIRFSSPDLAIAMNLSTYFLEAWLFSSALTSLLDKQYLTGRRFWAHIGCWVAYTLVWGVLFFSLPQGIFRTVAMLSTAFLFFVYAVWLARRLLRTYKRAAKAMDDYYSDDVVNYIRWMSRFTYWAAVFGVMVGGLTFLPEKYIFLWILSAIPFYIYLFVSYMNYLLFCQQVQEVFDNQPADCELLRSGEDMSLVNDEQNLLSHEELTAKIEQWKAERGFTKNGITIIELSVAIGSNRTYLAEYIKQKYKVPFRQWISGLRIEYARNLLIEEPNLSVADIAKIVGYNSYPHFVNLFSEEMLFSPAKWRKENAGKLGK